MKNEIADRLRDATDEAGRSIRNLQEELHDAGVPGSSYANVHAFFSGKSQPSVQFLAASAKALRVRPEWLAFGTLPRTGTEETAEKSINDFRDVHETLLVQTPLVRDTFRRVLGRLARFASVNGSEPSEGDLVELARRLEIFLEMGVREHVLGGDLMPKGVMAQMNPEHAHLAMLHAILLWIPKPVPSRFAVRVPHHELPGRGEDTDAEA